MSPRTREMLDQIDTFLVRRGSEAGELWDILTALRGPDSENETIKKYATCPIRRAAFPKLAKLSVMGCVPGPSGSVPGMGRMEDSGYQNQEYSHFGTHANGAAQVLKLYIPER